MSAEQGAVYPGPAVATSDENAAEYRRRGWWREETFLDDLRRQARERPHKLAVAGRRLHEARTDTLDYSELAVLTERFAGALLELGVERGDFVAVQLPNRWEIVPLMFACIRVGAVICPIAPVCRENDLRHRLSLTGAKVCVTVDEWEGYPLAKTLIALRGELALEHVVVVGGHTPEQAVDFHDHFVAEPWERVGRRDPAGRELGPDDPFVVLFTSGTTGDSKGVLHSQNTIHSAVRGYVDTFLLREDLVAALTTPLIHYSGFGQGVLAGVMLGGTVVFQDLTDNSLLPDLIERYGATLLYGPPPTLTAVAESQRAEPRDVSSLRHVVTGAAPVLQQLVDELRETFGAQTYSVWGMSEFGPVTITRLDYNQDWAAHSHGRPIDSMAIRIDACHDPSKRAPVGRLRVRGASRALGYYKRADAFDAEMNAEGWFDTGDVAREDGRGGIRLLGRAKDAILRDGIVVPMAELEAIIARHPKVTEAAVVGPAGRLDDLILAVVVPRGDDPPSLEEVRAHLAAAGQEARFLPDRLEVLAALPKTLTGKVRKIELRERYAGQEPVEAGGAR
ncbi:AMP-binding protein [Streptomyces sp. NBC_01218]|uniref:AMP-binding protein n=1 Tax=unclassified Streptomyces TaxID=2593676 RepID=UPI0023B9E01C|nr:MULTISPECIES: AMP-binding protein [unclassified Streptomyces]WEH43458.1 AMP-binding protein [Streptomyces sp. AM 2-1-1]WSQ49748.1 AMP-binding protein [Streptomyces sp. NBC_01218]WSQ55093.1 AMP-binding protein [Streptomyces sp. NBC_01218]